LVSTKVANDFVSLFLILCIFSFFVSQQERSAIIHRFREKRKRRVWKKKIRYFCRKNLADRRVRVKGRFVKSVAKAPGASGASTSSTGSDQSPSTGGTSRSASGRGGSAQAVVTRPSHQRTHSGSGDGTDVSDLTGVTYTNSRLPRPTAAKGVRTAARQALTSPGSDDDDEEDEEDEGSEGEGNGEGDDGDYSMEVVIGSNSDAGSSSSALEADKKPPRLLKLVLTSSHGDSAPHSTVSASSGNGKLVFRAPVKSEPGAADTTSAAAETSSQDLSGVDILASLAAQAASESDPDDVEDGDGDVFTAERDLMRLPSAKRIRRHSIAY
jgi:hypothetical protein